MIPKGLARYTRCCPIRPFISSGFSLSRPDLCCWRFLLVTDKNWDSCEWCHSKNLLHIFLGSCNSRLHGSDYCRWYSLWYIRARLTYTCDFQYFLQLFSLPLHLVCTMWPILHHFRHRLYCNLFLKGHSNFYAVWYSVGICEKDDFWSVFLAYLLRRRWEASVTFFCLVSVLRM